MTSSASCEHGLIMLFLHAGILPVSLEQDRGGEGAKMPGDGLECDSMDMIITVGGSLLLLESNLCFGDEAQVHPCKPGSHKPSIVHVHQRSLPYIEYAALMLTKTLTSRTHTIGRTLQPALQGTMHMPASHMPMPLCKVWIAPRVLTRTQCTGSALLGQRVQLICQVGT